VKAKFQSSIDPCWFDIQPVRLGEVPMPLTTADCFVVIEDGDNPRMRIDIYGDSHSAFCDVLFWKGFVVIGWDYDVHFVDMESGNAKTISLGSYFGHLYSTESFLLAASGENLFLFDEKAQLQWISNELGIDGVVVNDIDAQFIYGEGEWDPPSGWKPFRVKVDSGVSV
jgi:hypothetical protein